MKEINIKKSYIFQTNEIYNFVEGVSSLYAEKYRASRSSGIELAFQDMLLPNQKVARRLGYELYSRSISINEALSEVFSLMAAHVELASKDLLVFSRRIMANSEIKFDNKSDKIYLVTSFENLINQLKKNGNESDESVLYLNSFKLGQYYLNEVINDEYIPPINIVQYLIDNFRAVCQLDYTYQIMYMLCKCCEDRTGINLDTIQDFLNIVNKIDFK